MPEVKSTLSVLYLAPPRTVAGSLTAFTFVDEEILALASAGVKVHVLTYPLADDSGVMSHPNVTLCPLPSGKTRRERSRTLRFLRDVRRLVPALLWRHPRVLYHVARIERFAADLVREHDIDVLHSNFGWPDGFGGVLAAHVSGRPLVATMRGMDVIVDPELDYGLRLKSTFESAIRVLLARADRTTHVSDFIRDAAISLGARAEAARTVCKGVDCERFRPLAAGHARATPPIVLTVAGLIRRKGVDGILQALARIREDTDFEFVVAGRGPERENLEALARSLGLADRTRFLGYVDRDSVMELFARAEVFVLGSVWEGSGNVLLEAMASACPVVCTRSGGPPEYVADGVTGYVVPVRDAAAMGDRIADLLGDPALRDRFGKQARERVEELYRYERMIDDIVDVYSSLNRQRRHPTTRAVPVAGTH